MIELTLRDFSSSDISNVWKWSPNRPSDVFFELTIEVGVAGLEGGHLFQLLVATPQGLQRVADSYSEYQFPDRAVLLFVDYSWQCLMDRLLRILKLCSRDSWDDSLAVLQRYFVWEYEAAASK